MKIFYAAQSAVPSRTANSLNVVKMCDAFVRAGHDLILAVPKREAEREPVAGDIWTYYGLESRFRVVRLPWWPPGARTAVFGTAAALCAWRVGADIFYTRSAAAGGTAARIGLPVVYEAHTYHPPERGREARRVRRILEAERFLRLVVISDALFTAYRDGWDIDERQLVVARSAADPPRQTARTLAWDDRLHVGYSGHLYDGKGLDVIAQLVPLCPQAMFHIVGGMELDITRWRARLAGHTNVRFYGHLPPPEAESLRQSFDVALAPNQEVVRPYGSGTGADIGRWTSPTKIFEYMAAGVPVVASDLPVLREFLNERNAVLVDPRKPEAWAAAINQLRDPVLRNALASQARSDLERHFTWARRVQRVLSGLDSG